MKYTIMVIIAAVAIVIGAVHAQSILTDYCSSTPSSTSIVNNVAPWYCNDINPAIMNEWSQYFPIMSLAIMVSYSIAALVFMFGVALRNDRLRTFGTAEIYEATATAIMVILFTFIAAVMFGLLPALTSGPINPFDASLGYISGIINQTYVTESNMFTAAAIDYGYASFVITVSTPGFNFGAAIGQLAGLAIAYYFFWPAFIVVSLLFEGILSLFVQFYLIVFMMYAAIPVFLIPGIIFRALIPTRNLGGMMIAVAIGFYFIMPTLWAVAYASTSGSISAQLTQTQTALDRYGSGNGLETNALSASSPLATTVANMRAALGPYFLSILFFPAVIIALTYALITQIAEILGGMAKTSARLRSLV